MAEETTTTLEAPAAPPAPFQPGTDTVAPPPPKPGSARARLFDALDQAANPKAQPSPETRPETPKQKTEAKEPGERIAIDDEPGSDAEETPEETPEAKPEEKQQEDKPDLSDKPDKPKKVSPWKLVDEWKGKHAELEKKLAEVDQKGLAEEERTQFSQKLSALEARNKELENEIKFVDYAKSAEFREQYQKPYETAWERALGELQELTVEENGTERPINAQDILQLVQLPLAKAREAADERFGVFADDVMAHRKEIKRLFDQQNQALAKAKEDGGSRLKQMQETQQRQQAEIAKTLTDTWTKANEEIVKDANFGKYFAPVEGDEEANVRLTKGYELVDKAFSENPSNPNLTPEERQTIVRRHAAVRNRAAAFGRLVYQVTRTEQKLAAVEAELAKYKETEPTPTGGRKAPETVKPAGKAIDRMMAELDSLAGMQR